MRRFSDKLTHLYYIKFFKVSRMMTNIINITEKKIKPKKILSSKLFLMYQIVVNDKKSGGCHNGSA